MLGAVARLRAQCHLASATARTGQRNKSAQFSRACRTCDVLSSRLSSLLTAHYQASYTAKQVELSPRRAAVNLGNKQLRVQGVILPSISSSDAVPPS